MSDVTTIGELADALAAADAFRAEGVKQSLLTRGEKALLVLADHVHARRCCGPTTTHDDVVPDDTAVTVMASGSDVTAEGRLVVRHRDLNPAVVLDGPWPHETAKFDAKGRGPEYDRGFADGRNAQRAEGTPEIVSGAEAAELPDGTRLIPCKVDGTPLQGATVRSVVDGVVRMPIFTEDDNRLLVIRKPVAPLAVGDTVETAAQLDALPVDTALRDRQNDVVKIGPGRALYAAGDPEPLVAVTILPARILDLPEAGL